MTKTVRDQYFSNWGPLGFGYAKVCEVICAWYLLSSSVVGDSSKDPIPFVPVAFDLGPLPSATSISAVCILSMISNEILALWSKLVRSRGSHSGVNAMVHDTIGRQLTISEHLRIFGFAVLNAICEELISRGFFMYELLHVGQTSKLQANLGQAIAFGIWHYHGIPSGMIGVCLTFVYGFVMGILWEYGGGLLLPIMAHSIADYFIFSVIVRNKDNISGKDE